MTLNLKKIVGWAIASFLILGLIYIIYIRHEFEHNYKVVTGKVIEITTSRHSDYSLIYTFEVNHKKYFGNTDLNLCGIIKIGDVKYFTLNKLFPIAYDTLSPSASSLIISLSSAEHFKYKMPDSLYPCLRHLDCDYYLNVTPEDYSK